MYMPTLARFTALDPLPPEGEPVLLGRHIVSRGKKYPTEAIPILPYAYCFNNPINLTDPSGLKPQWQEKCSEPDSQVPPDGEPQKGDACFYPGRKVCYSVGIWPFCFEGCWESQCVCQCVGNSPGINCVRACIRCADDNGAPKNTIEAEQWCQKEVCVKVLTNRDLRVVNCCTQNNSNLGGCLGSKIAAPLNPNPGDKRCQNIPELLPKK